MPINTVQKKQGAIKEYSQNEALIINKELDKRRITNSKLVEKIIGEQNSIPFEVLAGPKDSIKLEKPETIIFSNEPYDAPISNIFLEGTYEVSELSPEVEIAMTLTGALNYCNLLNNESLEGKPWEIGTVGMMKPFIGKTSSINHLLTSSVRDNQNDGWVVIDIATGEEKICYDSSIKFKFRLVR